MSDANQISRKELLQPNRMEKKLYAFADHAYREKRLYISSVAIIFVLILAIWGGWKYVQNERVHQANQYHLARATLNNSALSEEERFTEGIKSLMDFASSKSDSTLSVIALMESGEIYARQSQIEKSITVFRDVIKHTGATTFLRNSARLSLAALFEQQQRWDEAKLMLDTININSWEDLKWRAMARISVAKGEIENAKSLLEQLLEKVPDSIFRQETENLLMSL